MCSNPAEIVFLYHRIFCRSKKTINGRVASNHISDIGTCSASGMGEKIGWLRIACHPSQGSAFALLGFKYQGAESLFQVCPHHLVPLFTASDFETSRLANLGPENRHRLIAV